MQAQHWHQQVSALLMRRAAMLCDQHFNAHPGLHSPSLLYRQAGRSQWAAIKSTWTGQTHSNPHPGLRPPSSMRIPMSILGCIHPVLQRKLSIAQLNVRCARHVEFYRAAQTSCSAISHAVQALHALHGFRQNSTFPMQVSCYLCRATCAPALHAMSA